MKMSELCIINGTLEECQKEVNERERDYHVFVANARSVLEESPLLGSGTGFQPPKVKVWQMLLQCVPRDE
jgi:hypothetical protein